MAKAKKVRSCGVAEARSRLTDARQFLQVTEMVDAADVVASNAILSAIASTDAICCYALGERSSSGDHSAAVALLGKVDKKLAATLRRALDLKTKASYESADVSSTDAKACIRRAKSLLKAAEERLK